jgi:hypothetical protein
MIRLVTAPERLDDNSFKVFMAGGIQKCEDWQSNLASHLMNVSWIGDITLVNPRQAKFDMSDPTAGEKQIKWEFDYLNKMDMFTMFFYGPTESDQPICFYELGRYIEVMKRRFPSDWQHRIVVTACKDFGRCQDVIVQTSLATDGKVEAVSIDGYQMAISVHRYNVSRALLQFFDYVEYKGVGDD